MLTSVGTPSSSASNVLRRRTAPIRALRSRLAITASRSVSRLSAPNDLTTVTPSKLSCTAALKLAELRPALGRSNGRRGAGRRR